MASTDIYDVVVVGAGIEGSSTAYHLAKKGQKTLLLEQYPLPHSRGSSHGQTRILRKSYGTDGYYSFMMKEAHKIWLDLESETGIKVFHNSGYVRIFPKMCDQVNVIEKSMKMYGISYDRISVDEARQMCPLMEIPADAVIIRERESGYLLAEKGLQSFQEQFKRYGGVIQDAEPLLHLVPGQIVILQTSKSVIKTKAVVLTMGPWSGAFLKTIGITTSLQPMRITVCYWKERSAGSHTLQRLVPFSYRNACGPHHVYGLPSIEYPGHVKICLHDGPEIDPETRDAADDSWVISLLQTFVRKHFPGLEPTPSIIETCMYTNTPTEDYILDTHPQWKNIVIGAGFSGHGFKQAPVVGKILSEIVTTGSSTYDLKRFKLDPKSKTLSNL